MYKINKVKFDTLVKHYDDILAKSENGTLDQALKAESVNLLKLVSELIYKESDTDKPVQKAISKKQDLAIEIELIEEVKDEVKTSKKIEKTNKKEK